MKELNNITLQIKYNDSNDTERIPKENELVKGELYYDQTTNKLYCGRVDSGSGSVELIPINGVTSNSGEIFGYTIDASKISKTKNANKEFSFGDTGDYVFVLKNGSEIKAGLKWDGTLTGDYSIKGMTVDTATKLTCGTVGNNAKPVYFQGGVPAACSGWIPVSINGFKNDPGDDKQRKIYAPTASVVESGSNKYLKVVKNNDGSYTIDAADIGNIKIITLDTNNAQPRPLLVEDNAGQVARTGKLMWTEKNKTFVVTGSVSATSFNATSDKRLKENIETYKSDKSITDLDVYSFNFKDDEKKEKQIGILAQDLQEICPELVCEDEKGYLSIKESKLVYLLLNEVKELKKEIEELKNGRQE